MSILLTKGNIDDVFKVLDNHNINSALMLDTKLKVLEIIKKKGVILSILEYSQTVEDYNNAILFSFKPSAYEMCKLTKEEFELLKQYFGKNIQK